MPLVPSKEKGQPASRRQAFQFPDDEDDNDVDDRCPIAALSLNNSTADMDNSTLEVDNSAEVQNHQNPSKTSNGSQPQSEQDEVSCSDSASDSPDDDEEGSGPDPWKEEDGKDVICECIICSHQTTGYESTDLMKVHIETTHKLSFDELKSKYKLDYVGFIQFVRWARDLKRRGVVEEEIGKLFSNSDNISASAPWLADKYSLHSNQEQSDSIDYFLTLDFFALEDCNSEQGKSDSGTVQQLLAEIEKLQADKQLMVDIFQRTVIDNKSGKRDMGCTSSKFRKRFRLPIPRAVDSLQLIRPSSKPVSSDSSSQNMISNTPSDNVLNASVDTTASEIELRHIRLAGIPPNERFGPQIDDNNLYFDSYNEIGIHHDMLFDGPRTDSYQLAIIEQAKNMKGAKVLDLGCGTGILSMFCAQQNTKMVYAIDKSDIIYDAMSNGFENGFEHRIKYMHKNVDSEDLETDGRVDILISEFMGYFLFFEGMTETFIRTRDKYLRKGGIIMPDQAEVVLVPLGSKGVHKSQVRCWDNVYGFKMPAMKTRAMKEVLLSTVTPDETIGKPIVVKSLNFNNCKVEDIQIDTCFEIQFDRSAKFSALAGYFNVTFSGVNNKIVLDTSPFSPPTHWKQCVFFNHKLYKVGSDSMLAGRIRSYPHPDNPRWLTVEITIENETVTYQVR